MSIAARLKRIAKLGNGLAADYHIENALELNSLQMANVEAMKQMMETEGWALFRYQMEKDLADKEKTLVDLASDPEKNKLSLMVNAVIRKQLRRQLDFIEGVVSKEKQIIDERNRLSQTA